MTRLLDNALAWRFHRNTARWAHNAATSDGRDDIPEPGLEHPDRPFSPLPEPAPIGITLAEALAGRCSCRDFADHPVETGALGELLHHGYGVLGRDHWRAAEFLERPVPSGGGMYPLELHVIARNISGLADGIYHYVPLLHGLERAREVRVPDTLLRYLFMGQYPVMIAPLIVVISSVPGRSMKKYADRGYRYILMEAGHVAQNLNLAAIGLGLQSLNLGGFFDDELGRLCGMDEGEEFPLYAVAVGHGASRSKHQLRFSE